MRKKLYWSTAAVAVILLSGQYNTTGRNPGKKAFVKTGNKSGARASEDPAYYDLLLLRGKDLACNCRLDEICHADVLLELANKPE